MLYTDEFTEKHLRKAFEIVAKHAELDKATQAVYKYIKSLKIQATDYDMREQTIAIVKGNQEIFWRGEKIGDWIKPAGPFKNVEDFFMYKTGERIDFNEFCEKFLGSKNVNAPSSNVTQ